MGFRAYLTKRFFSVSARLFFGLVIAMVAILFAPKYTLPTLAVYAEEPNVLLVTGPEAIIPQLAVGPCSLIQSDFMAGSHGNYEIVVLEDKNLIHYFKANDDPFNPFSRGPIVSTQATGPGCLIQSDFMAGGHGNFEAVVLEGNNLVHYFKVNDDINSPWQRGVTITGQATGPGCIMQSSFSSGEHGNFEVIVPEGKILAHYFKNNGDINNPWLRAPDITNQASGPACIIESDFTDGEHGNFEVVALEGSNLVHYFKSNTDVSNPWVRGPVITTKATGPGSLIQSDFVSQGHGNLEVVVPEGNRLVHYFFADVGNGRQWKSGQVVTNAAAGTAGLIASDFVAGEHGNFEVLALVADPAGCHTAAPCVRHFFHVNDDVNNPWSPGYVVAYTGRSQRICQLTGDDDRERGYKTLNRTHAFGVWGTDLGIVTEHLGRTYYFFGDTVDTRTDSSVDLGGDTYAYSYDSYPEDCLQLEFVRENTNFWKSLIVPGVSMEAMEVPTGAFSANGNLYLFVMTDWDDAFGAKRHGRSILARSSDGGNSFVNVGTISFDRFTNVAPIVAATPGVAGLPSGAGVWLWGSGHYRQSPVYLAWLPLSAVDNDPRAAMRFYAGIRNGQPVWSNQESEAVALTNRCLCGRVSGELESLSAPLSSVIQL